MNYPTVNPPYIFNEFRTMKRKEAESHFNWFIQYLSERLDVLKSYSRLNLNFTEASLLSVWSWYLKRIEIYDKSEDEIFEERSKQHEWFHEYI